MAFNPSDIESIVRKIVSEMNGAGEHKHECCGGHGGECKCGKHSAGIPKTAKVAMLTKTKTIEIKEFPIPELQDDDILVKVEGAGICGTDVHEWRADPFGLMPVVLGHEGTGEIIALGKNIKTDTSGKPIKVGDKVVTSVISCGECNICRNHPANTNLCDKQGVFGLIPHNDEQPLLGWFATHLLIRGKGATYFVVNDLDLYERMILELACVCVHALKRANGTGLMNFNTKVVIQGLGPVGLVMACVLRAAGINHIIAIDGTQTRLDMAKKLGVKTVINFKEAKTLEERVELVKEACGGNLADFAFQCTGVPAAAADIYSYIRRGGGMCEMGFFVNNGEYQINPHFTMCNKEINLVGSWDYSADDYPTTMAFLRQAREMNIPIKELITHTYPLEKMNEAMEMNVSQQGIKICYVAE